MGATPGKPASREGKGTATAATAASVPLVPLRDLVIFPQGTETIRVGRAGSLAALDAAAKGKRPRLALVTQLDMGCEEPGPHDLHGHGCLVEVRAVEPHDNNQYYRVTVRGLSRLRVNKVKGPDANGMLACTCTALGDTDIPGHREAKRLMREIIDVLCIPRHQARARELAAMEEGYSAFIDTCAMALDLPRELQLKIQATRSVIARQDLVHAFMLKFAKVHGMELKLRGEARADRDQRRRDHLRARAAHIQEQLAENSVEDAAETRRRIDEAGMTAEAHEKCLAELDRLGTMAASYSEASFVRAYIDTLLALPWRKRAGGDFDLGAARAILDADHHGLDKVKDRIIEHLAVQRRVGTTRSPVLCLLGPPGVGKTSLGRSVARATGRPFVRVSLGGVHDEPTIRGHRRTYLGSIPGRILNAMIEAKVRDPVCVLDEIDKLGHGLGGDPMAALLEVLDPEQNSSFVDHFVEVGFDLSEVMFILTANSVESMYGALRDRLETIEIPGYTDSEKVSIAQSHLVPRALAASGLDARTLRFGEAVLHRIITDHTAEAGVRNLERAILRICRKTVLAHDLAAPASAVSAVKPVTLTAARVRDLLDPPRQSRLLRRSDSVGIVNGLAVTTGDSLGLVHQIDALRLPGDKFLVKSGNLKASVEHAIDTAASVVRAMPERFGVTAAFLAEHQVHVHYPHVDVAHDGNSNGLALFALLVSALTDIPVRVDTAITGAVNLRGAACAVGGIRAKLLGAWRERIRRVIIPAVQEREIAGLPRDLADNMEVITATDVHDVLRELLVRVPAPVKPTAAAAAPVVPPPVRPGRVGRPGLI